jgi:hypothetical protein
MLPGATNGKSKPWKACLARCSFSMAYFIQNSEQQ